MILAILIVIALALPSTALAATFTFLLPTGRTDAACNRVPGAARISRIRTYVANFNPARTLFYNRWTLLTSQDIPAGSQDGRLLSRFIPRTLYVPGDSIGVRVAVADSAVWNCRDEEFRWRVR